MNTIKLSPSVLNIYRNCPRCFWLAKVKGVPRPRGIFPSLPSGMDRGIKSYFDGFRVKQRVPPELSEFNAEFKLYPDQSKLDLWREWRTGLQYVDGNKNVLFGALDELVVINDLHVPFDYKTKGSPTSPEDAQKYYQLQLDCYALMLESNGMKTAGYGVLMYYSPNEVRENGQVQFQTQLIKIKTDIQRAINVFTSAIDSLTGDLPNPSKECEYCPYVHKTKQF